MRVFVESASLLFLFETLVDLVCGLESRRSLDLERLLLFGERDWDRSRLVRLSDSSGRVFDRGFELSKIIIINIIISLKIKKKFLAVAVLVRKIFDLENWQDTARSRAENTRATIFVSF